MTRTGILLLLVVAVAACSAANVNLLSGEKVIGSAPKNQIRYYEFMLDAPSSFVLNVAPRCHSPEPLKVYVRYGKKPTCDEHDAIIDEVNHHRQYSKVITPPVGTTGKVYIGVEGAMVLRAACDFSITVRWGPSICTMPKRSELSFCGSLVDYPVVNEEIAEPGALKVLDSFARFSFETAHKGRGETCQQAIKASVCAQSFKRCDANGFAMPVCKGMCESFAGTCDVDGSVNDAEGLDPLRPGCATEHRYAGFPNCTQLPLSIEYASRQLEHDSALKSTISAGAYDYFHFEEDRASSYIVKVQPVDCRSKDPLDVKVLYRQVPNLESWDEEAPIAAHDGSYTVLGTPDGDASGRFYVSVAADSELEDACDYSVTVKFGPSICKRVNTTFCGNMPYAVVDEDQMFRLGNQMKDAFLAYQADHAETAVADGACKDQMKRFLCSTGFKKCNEWGLVQKPCQEACISYAETCGVNPFDGFKRYDASKPGCHEDGIYSTDAATCAAVPLAVHEEVAVEEEVCEGKVQGDKVVVQGDVDSVGVGLPVHSVVHES